MRTLTAAQLAVFESNQYGFRWRVQVKEAGPVWRDLSTYPGFNACASATVKTDIDADVWNASIELRRAVDDLSLAGLKTTSPVNLGFAWPGVYAPLLQPGREVKIDIAYVGADQTPLTGDWVNIFHGDIDSVDDGPDPIQIECRDLGRRLQDRFIEEEFVYGAGPTTAGVRIWKANEDYELDELLVPADPNGHYYKVTTAGTTDNATPTFNTGAGSTTNSGTAVFTEQGATSGAGTPAEALIQAILDDTLGAGAVSLYTPVASAWDVKQWLQTREPVGKPPRMLAEQRGWNVRYKFDTGTNAWRYTLYGPDRAKVVPDQTFAAGRVRKTTQALRDLTRVRNRIKVIYSDSSDRWPDGTPKRKWVLVEDLASQAKYGIRFMEVAEEDTSHIDTEAEALAFANAMLSDLSEPELGLGVIMAAYPFADLGDLYEFAADAKRFDEAQKLAVVGITHTLKGGREQSCATQLQLNGKPSAGVMRHLRKEARPGVKPNHALQLWNSGSKVNVLTEVVGGTRLKVSADLDKRTKWEGIEVHVSTVSGFNPTAATLKSKGRFTDAEIADLIPGVTYYVKTRPYGFNDTKPVYGEYSAQQSFVAGYARPKHIHPSFGEVGLPLNGSFELYDAVTLLPECWEMDEGTWGVDLSLDTIAFDGAASVMFLAVAGTKAIRSQQFVVRPSTDYTVRVAFRPQAAFPGARTAVIKVRWYTSAGALISTSDQNVALGSLTAATFAVQEADFTSPATAAFGRIVLCKESTDADFRFHVDGVHFDETVAAGGGSSADVEVNMTAGDLTYTSVTPATVTDGTNTFEKAIAANAVVGFRARLQWHVFVGGTGLNVQIGTPTSPARVTWKGTYQSGGGTEAMIAATGVGPLTFPSYATATPIYVEISGQIINGANAGDVSIKVASNNGNAVTLNGASWVEWY